jgi:hypothetical protein
VHSVDPPTVLVSSNHLENSSLYEQAGYKLSRANALSESRSGADSFSVGNIEYKQFGQSCPDFFLQTPADERLPSFSPEGKWLTYAFRESGSFRVYVRAFPDTGGKWQISSDGGNYPM